jgi:predicted ATPase
MTALKIRGYRPFRDFTAALSPLEVIVGSNGAGKTALFEFLKFLRDSVRLEIPPEIIPGAIGRQLFHVGGDNRFSWNIDIASKDQPIKYMGQLINPTGQLRITHETLERLSNTQPVIFFQRSENQANFEDLDRQVIRPNANQLALSMATNPDFPNIYNTREYILGWRFYGTNAIGNDRIRQPVPPEEKPILREDGGNLSAVLFYLMTEHRQIFDDLQQSLRLMIPGFKGIAIKARGRGEVVAFWQEQGIDDDLSLADISDGVLRLLCWSVLCLTPEPPSLICIDEPDQGLHPRTLPILAGLFQKASQRTQILLATHASYFLTQFPVSSIAVMRKNNGAAEFLKPENSQLLLDTLDDFGTAELEHLHRSDELEWLSNG